MKKTLQDDENYRIEVIKYGGKRAVKKTVKETAPAKRADLISNEIYGMQFFTELLTKNPHINMYIPKVYEQGDRFYTREYIDAEPIGENQGRLNKLAKVLADIDCIEPDGEIRFIGSSDYRDITKYVDEWLEEPLKESMVSASRVKQANQMFQSLKTYLRPRIAHGDMSSFKHAYLRTDGKVALIDFENFTPNAARYYDLAWGFTRLYSFAASTDTPKYFLNSFLNFAEQADHQEEQLLAIILQRTLGMQYDAWKDESKGQHYKDRAAELLELVLQNRLELLFK